jgi:Right handed beta helix region
VVRKQGVYVRNFVAGCVAMLVVTALAPGFVMAQAGASLPVQGTFNPDPSHIVRAGAHVIEVTPAGESQDVNVRHPLADVSPFAGDDTFSTLDQRGVGFAWKTATQDVVNVQWAVQNVGSRGTVRLKHGIFNFGSSAVYLPDVSLVGDGLNESGDPRTVIEGGLVPIRVAYLHGGERVRVDSLWFRGATYMAVNAYYIDIDRLEVTNNKITQMQLLPESSLLPYRFAVWVEGWEHCSVRGLRVQGNEIDNVEDTPQLPPSGGSDFGVDDNGVDVVFCAVNDVTITDNVIRNQGEPIEVYGNLGSTAEIVVVHNDLAVAGDATVGAYGLVVANNEGAKVSLAGNHLTLRNGFGDSFAILVSHRTPGSSFEIRDNVVSIEGSAFAAMLVGLLDASLSNALIAGNSFSGNASDGIWVDDLFGFANQSRNNRFLHNDLSQLHVEACSVRLGPSTRNNRFIGNMGLALTAACDKGDHNELRE